MKYQIYYKQPVAQYNNKKYILTPIIKKKNIFR